MSEINQYTPGTFCWVEAGISDQMSAKSFYAKVFGWDTHDSPLPGGGSYTLLRKNGKDVGGLYQLNPDQKKMGIPPHWMVYFAVADCDGIVEQVKGLGGTVMAPPSDIPSVGRFAILQDPQRAAFAVLKLAGPVS